MSDMLDRAAKAIADKWLEKVDDSTVRVGPPVIARAALLAALDPEDEALVNALALPLGITDPPCKAHRELIQDTLRRLYDFVETSASPSQGVKTP